MGIKEDAEHWKEFIKNRRKWQQSPKYRSYQKNYYNLVTKLKRAEVRKVREEARNGQ